MTRRAHTAAPPRSVDEALRRSAHHARNALAEALLAANALLDAVAIALTDAPASAPRDERAAGGAALASLSIRIDELARAMRGSDANLPMGWGRAILEALNVEIARWEERSTEDPDARAVLRAFLGLREILWEFGVRSDDAEPEGATGPVGSRPDEEEDGRTAAGPRTPGADPERAPRARRGRGARVQRIEVEG